MFGKQLCVCILLQLLLCWFLASCCRWEGTLVDMQPNNSHPVCTWRSHTSIIPHTQCYTEDRSGTDRLKCGDKPSQELDNTIPQNQISIYMYQGIIYTEHFLSQISIRWTKRAGKYFLKIRQPRNVPPSYTSFKGNGVAVTCV